MEDTEQFPQEPNLPNILSHITVAKCSYCLNKIDPGTYIAVFSKFKTQHIMGLCEKCLDAATKGLILAGAVTRWLKDEKRVYIAIEYTDKEQQLDVTSSLTQWTEQGFQESA